MTDTPPFECGPDCPAPGHHGRGPQAPASGPPAIHTGNSTPAPMTGATAADAELMPGIRDVTEPFSSPDFTTREEEAEAHWQAAYEAAYGTYEEQQADAALAEAEAIVQAEAATYGDPPLIFPAPDGPREPEADL